MLIVAFLEKGFDDFNTLDAVCRQTQDMDLSWICRDYWPEVDYASPDRSDLIAIKFRDHMYGFWPPDFSDGRFLRLHRDTVMPFTEESRIGAGVPSRVYAFKAHKNYMKLPVRSKFFILL